MSLQERTVEEEQEEQGHITVRSMQEAVREKMKELKLQHQEEIKNGGQNGKAKSGQDVGHHLA